MKDDGRKKFSIDKFGIPGHQGWDLSYFYVQSLYGGDSLCLPTCNRSFDFAYVPPLLTLSLSLLFVYVDPCKTDYVLNNWIHSNYYFYFIWCNNYFVNNIKSCKAYNPDRFENSCHTIKKYFVTQHYTVWHLNQH